MGKGAARMGDMVKTCGDPTDMPTSSVIVPFSTVMVNNMPAAKMNDMVVGVDIHIIMIPTPGGPVPTPLPHPYNGSIKLNCSTTVKIMGQPAAMVGSKSQGQPPHIPQGGPFQKPPTNMGEIMLGSFNVMIGNGGGGGGGAGSGGKSSARAAAKAGAISSGSGSGDSSEAEAKTHFLNVEIVDKADFPIMGAHYVIKDPEGLTTGGAVTGGIQQEGIAEGDYEISLKAVTKAAWSAAKARDGEKVKLQVEGAGFDDGEEVVFVVWQKDINRPDTEIARIEDKTFSGGKAEAEWTYEFDPEAKPPEEGPGAYSSPKFYFTVEIGEIRSRSGMLDYRDWVEINLKDPEGQAVADQDYTLRTPTGELRKGKTDSKGYAKEENIPPGAIEVGFPEAGNVGSQD